MEHISSNTSLLQPSSASAFFLPIFTVSIQHIRKNPGYGDSFLSTVPWPSKVALEDSYDNLIST